MNFEIIKNSNQYKHYKRFLRVVGFTYLGTLIVFIPLAIVMTAYNESITILSVFMIVFMSVMSISVFIITVIRIKRINRDKDLYERFSGTVLEIKRIKPPGRHSPTYREATIYSEQLKKYIRTVVFKGDRNKIIKIDHPVEFFYNSQNDHVITINPKDF